jgi:hypothetical protein
VLSQRDRCGRIGSAAVTLDGAWFKGQGLGALQECQSAPVDESLYCRRQCRQIDPYRRRKVAPREFSTPRVRSAPQWAEPTSSRRKKRSAAGARCPPSRSLPRLPTPHLSVNHTDRVPGLLRLASFRCVREVLFGPGSKFGNRAETAATQCRRLPCVPPSPAKCPFSRLTKLKGT